MKVRPQGRARRAAQIGALLAASLGLSFAPPRLAEALRAGVGMPLRPLQWVAFRASHRVAGLFRAWDGEGADRPSLEELAERVRRLENELAHQKELLQDARRKLANLGHEYPDGLAPVAVGDVIAHDASDWRRSLVVDRGARAGVRPGMVALWDGALVGRVTAVEPFSARIRLLTEPASRVAVRSVRSRAAGLLAGAGARRCHMKYVGYMDDVQVGDEIVTAGADGLFPPHLVVGRCVASERNSGELLRTVSVEPAVLPARLESVVLVDWPRPPLPEDARPTPGPS